MPYKRVHKVHYFKGFLVNIMTMKNEEENLTLILKLSTLVLPVQQPLVYMEYLLLYWCFLDLFPTWQNLHYSPRFRASLTLLYQHHQSCTLTLTGVSKDSQGSVFRRHLLPWAFSALK